jgi:general secretion pathway protein C
MRLALDPRARRLLARFPRANVYSALELFLLFLLALQCARLVWVIVTPVGPVGDWKPESALRPATASAGLLGSFDPFFRLTGQTGPVVVTSLNLTLYGIRQDQASGRGAAIIATPDGVQRSFAVGEEIVPGVTLVSVAFDSVTISRGGAKEQLFMDQSPAAQVVGPPQGAALQPAPPMMVAPPAPAGAPGASGAPPAPQRPDFAADIAFQPRMNGSGLTGVVVAPQGSGNAFRAAGLAPGDVIVAVNGRRLRSPDQARSIASDLANARDPILQVERDGRVITLRPRIGR